MTKVKLRTFLNCALLVAALITASNVSADTFAFSYVFDGTIADRQSYAPGSKLTGQLDGTIDSTDPTGNSVIINSFGAVSLSRAGVERFDYLSIEADEFNTYFAGGTPRASFDGSNINFRVCAGGFTGSEVVGGPIVDCPLHSAAGGGFVVVTEAPFGKSFATAADGSGTLSVLYVDGVGATQGGRVTDIGPLGTLEGSWNLVLLPTDPTVEIDPSVSIGSGSSISTGVVVDEGVVMGDNTTVDKETNIGADTIIEDNVNLSKDVDVGSGATIGSNVIIGKGVVIEDGVVIGNDTTIGQGTHLCMNAAIGSAVTIGKNNLVFDEFDGVDVPDGIVLNGQKELATDCP